jgi:hypothetical protein
MARFLFQEQRKGFTTEARIEDEDDYDPKTLKIPLFVLSASASLCLCGESSSSLIELASCPRNRRYMLVGQPEEQKERLIL